MNGLGASNQPLGILQDTAVSTFALGTNGAAFDRTAAATLERTVSLANGDSPSSSLAFVTTPQGRYKARLTADFASGSIPLWANDGSVIGRQAIASNQMPANLTKGTSTTVCSAWIFGAFENLIIASFGGGLDIQTDPFSLKLQNLLDLSVRAYVDVGDSRPSAFQKVLDSVTP